MSKKRSRRITGDLEVLGERLPDAMPEKSESDTKPSPEPPPRLRALIGRVNEHGRLVMLVVNQDDVRDWAVLGWTFVATDPEDREALLNWYRETWGI